MDTLFCLAANFVSMRWTQISRLNLCRGSHKFHKCLLKTLLVSMRTRRDDGFVDAVRPALGWFCWLSFTMLDGFSYCNRSVLIFTSEVKGRSLSMGSCSYNKHYLQTSGAYLFGKFAIILHPLPFFLLPPPSPLSFSDGTSDTRRTCSASDTRYTIHQT